MRLLLKNFLRLAPSWVPMDISMQMAVRLEYPRLVRTLGPNITVWRVEDVMAIIAQPKEPQKPRQG